MPSPLLLCPTHAPRHYGQSQEFMIALERANIVFTAIFTAELVVRLVAQGPSMFW